MPMFPAKGNAARCRKTNTKYGFSSEAASNINYFFVYGKTYDDIISGYRNITGKAPLTPNGHWASGKAVSATNTGGSAEYG